MEKSLDVCFSTNTMVISYEKELDYFHKGIINVNEKAYETEAKEIADQIKWIKGFKSFAIGFGQIDWYERCNNFDVPYFICSENGRRVKKGYNSYNDIPKDWTVCYSLTMEIPSSIRGLNKFFEALKNTLRVYITDKQINEIKKAIKNKKYLNIEM